MDSKYSIIDLCIGMVSSGLISTVLSIWSQRRKENAGVDETVRNTLSEVIDDLRKQIDFLNGQIVASLGREKKYLDLISQTKQENDSLRAEHTAGLITIRQLTEQKGKYEQKLTEYETIYKRIEHD